jgi:hypothetical protein
MREDRGPGLGWAPHGPARVVPPPGRALAHLGTLRRDQGDRALLLRTLGRPDLAAQREQAALRLRKALLVRDIAVPLALLED